MTAMHYSIPSTESTSQGTATNSADSNDENMIRRLQAGDLDALGELYDRYKGKTYQTALSLTQDPVAAEDILQDCFLRLYRYAYSIDPTRPLMPWLYRVTLNLSYTWVKRRKCWFIPLEVVQERIINPQYLSPEKQAEGNEIQNEIVQALGSINIRHRTVIILYYLNSLSTEEIAEILGCPIGTVKSRLFHGRRKLRLKLFKSLVKTNDLKYEYASLFA